MNSYYVRTSSSIDYNLQAHHFCIVDGILYFYNENNDVSWCIKEWVSFFRMDAPKTPESPDEFYESIGN